MKVSPRLPIGRKFRHPAAPSPRRAAKPAALSLALLGTACGIMPTRNDIATVERVIPVDKFLTPIDIVLNRPLDFYYALLILPAIPFVEIGEIFTGRSNLPPVFSAERWVATPYGCRPSGDTLVPESARPTR